MYKWVGINRIYLLLGAVLVLTVVSYWPVLSNHAFVWDDDSYIRNNLLLKTFSLKEIFSRYIVGNYHPVTILVLAIEYHFFGLNALGYHAVSLLLHLLNVLLVFYALLLLSQKAEVALVAALLFGIHPLHVESVAWASELKDMLYTFFFLAAYVFYLKYINSLHKKFYVFALILFLLSLLSKAMAASLPVILLLTDYFKGRKINKPVLIEKAPFFILAVTLGVIAVFAQNVSSELPDFASPLPHRLVYASYGFITYLVKLLIPHHLSAFYPYPDKNTDVVEMIYYVFLVLGLIGVVIYSIRFSKIIFFGFGFFAVTVFLVLQLLPVGRAIMADRYSYIPSIGIFYLAGEGFYYSWKNKSKWLTIIVLSAFAIFFSVKTFDRCGIWKNEIVLWNDVIRQYEKVPLAYLNRGITYAKENEYDKAIEDLTKAIQLDTNYTKAYYNYAKAYYNRGNAYADKQKFDLALKDFNKCIELNPKYTQAYFNRGNIYSDRQEYDKAMADFSKAIELNPGEAKPYLNRGFIYGIRKEYDRALKDFDRAIALDPGDADAFFNKGYVLTLMTNYPEAIRNFSQSIRIRANDPPAYYYRGQAEYYSGDRDAALSDLRRAADWGYQPAEKMIKAISGAQ
jgi:protein O-mannosyl-transferase